MVFWSDESPQAETRLRISLLSPDTIGLWEADDIAAIFYEDFFFPDLQPDARGFIFFDSNTTPVVTEPLYFWSQPYDTLTVPVGCWPFLDMDQTTAINAVFFPSICLVNQRRRLAWSSYFGNFRTIFLQWLRSLVTTHIIVLQLVGVGFACDLPAPQLLRILVSNTNDLLLYLPSGVAVGTRPAVSEHADKLSFFLSSTNYQLVRLYSTFVRTRVRFNIYEYQGLVYTGEKKIKKLTKRKQK